MNECVIFRTEVFESSKLQTHESILLKLVLMGWQICRMPSVSPQ